MTFIPYNDKVEVRPFKKESIIATPDDNLLEMGEVIALGAHVEGQFLKVGDIVFFPAHGCWETPEVDGVKHYVVPVTSEFILGKIDVAGK